LARDADVGRKVASKRALDDAPTFQRRFAQEVRMMARLEHPNIASLYDVDEDESG
jgi:serine/threonine protein kinase